MANVESWPGPYTHQDWRDRGYKKFGTEIIKGNHRSEEVAIRFNKEGALFAGEIEGVCFASSKWHDLIGALAKHLRTREAITFERWIKVDYDRTRESSRHSITGKSWGGYGREDDRPISGIKLEFDVFDVSPPFKVNWASGPATACVWRRLERNPKGEWIVAAEDTQSEAIADAEGLFPFTEHRYQALVAIKEALVQLDGRLSVLFGEDTNGRTAALLDSLEPMTLLLAAGAVDEYMKPPPSIPTRKRK